MSTKDTREHAPGRERWERSEQTTQWRDIGISAVAAAARYATDRKPEPAPAPDGTPPALKILTLRDIEYFSA